MSTHEMDGIVLKKITFLVLLGTDFFKCIPHVEEVLSYCLQRKLYPRISRHVFWCHVPQKTIPPARLSLQWINLGSLIFPSLAVWFC